MRHWLFALILLFSPLSAHAEQQSLPPLPALVATYDVYVGGLHLVTADILFKAEKGKYKTDVKAKTYGFWYRALPWDGNLTAEGKIKRDRFVPVSYHNIDSWKHKPKTTKLLFDNKGDVKPEFDPPNNDQNREIVTPEQRKGALDPVTALLQMLANVAMEDSCDVTVPVFDGKRRFDITGMDGGREDIDEDDYNIYKGPTRVCDAEFKMISGAWKDGQEKARFWEKNDKGEKGREPFHIWLANLKPELPELPVKLESTSVFGLIVIHMTNWKYVEKNNG